MFGYLRDSDVIKSNFKVINKRWVALKDCEIYFPVEYKLKGLAEVSDHVYTLGVVMITVGTVYAVLSVNAMITFNPTSIEEIKYGNDPYYKLSFEAGDTVIENIDIVKQDTLPYHIYDLFISKGKIPAYMSYVDMCRLFETSKSYADANVGSRPEVVQLMISLIARAKEDKRIYYRQVVDSDPESKNLEWIKMSNIEYGATNTLNKLGGNYFSEGVASALINPTERLENIENLLRQ